MSNKKPEPHLAKDDTLYYSEHEPARARGNIPTPKTKPEDFKTPKDMEHDGFWR